MQYMSLIKLYRGKKYLWILSQIHSHSHYYYSSNWTNQFYRFLFLLIYPFQYLYLVLQSMKRFILYMLANMISKRRKRVWICIIPFEQCVQNYSVVAMFLVQTLKPKWKYCRYSFQAFDSNISLFNGLFTKLQLF